MNNENYTEHNVLLYDRKKLEMSGIADVSSFSDISVEMTYSGGYIAVDGAELKIESFSAETGRITITGQINSFCYYGKAPEQKHGFFRRFIS